ncbi:MAG: topology modulation protein [Oscillospiraceae bacterium]|nr:topology modulation protein [Oscillospiraceae bacterium]
MQRIIIIGCCGSGKSTLAVKLAQKLCLPLVHLDRLKFFGNWQERSKDEFNKLLLAELEKPRWIIDGNYNRTIPLRMEYCDTVIFLDFKRTACLWGVITRIIKYHGKTRPDMGGNCPERLDFEFLRFVWDFKTKHRKRYLEMLENAIDKKVIILRNRRQVKKFLNEVDK